MFGIDDALITLGGLIIPPVFDLIKKKIVGKDQDTPESTMSTLATTKAEVLPEYVKALADYTKGQVDFFNRDVIGSPSLWVINLRAAIRPITVILGIGILAAAMVWPDALVLDPGTRVFLEGNISSWFGSRLIRD